MVKRIPIRESCSHLWMIILWLCSVWTNLVSKWFFIFARPSTSFILYVLITSSIFHFMDVLSNMQCSRVCLVVDKIRIWNVWVGNPLFRKELETHSLTQWDTRKRKREGEKDDDRTFNSLYWVTTHARNCSLTDIFSFSFRGQARYKIDVGS